MSFLNLMQDKLKPKEVNDALLKLSEDVIDLDNKITSSDDASEISYNNTTSGLSATNVQSAIDEISTATGIEYDNTISGLTADDVQGAIDELSSDKIVYSFIHDGTTTIASALNSLYSENILNLTSYIKIGTTIAHLTEVTSSGYMFGSLASLTSLTNLLSLSVTSDSSAVIQTKLQTSGVSFVNLSSSTDIDFTVYNRN